MCKTERKKERQKQRKKNRQREQGREGRKNDKTFHFLKYEITSQSFVNF